MFLRRIFRWFFRSHFKKKYAEDLAMYGGDDKSGELTIYCPECHKPLPRNRWMRNPYSWGLRKRWFFFGHWEDVTTGSCPNCATPEEEW